MSNRSVYVTLAANVASFNAGMKSAAKAADDAAKSTDEVGAKAATTQQRMQTMANGMIAAGAVLATAVGASVAKFAAFDEAMSRVRATGEDARANIDALTTAAIELGGATKYSATEAADGIEALLKAGVSAQDVLGGGLSGALNLAASDNMAVADAAETAATAMTQFNLTGKDVPHIADLIAAGAGKAQGGVSDMAMALNQAGLVASQFDISLEDTVGTLSAFAAAGLIGSDAGTSFKSMLLALSTPSKQQAKLMDELGISAYDASGKFVGLSNLAEQLKTKMGGMSQAARDSAMGIIFGNDAIRAANVLYKQGADGIDGWVAAVNDAGYAAETAAIKQDNLKGDLEKLGGALDAAAISMGAAANGPLRNLVQGLTGMTDALAGNPELMQALGVAAGVAAGGLLLAGGAIKGLAVAAEVKKNMEALSISTEGLGRKALAGTAKVLALAAAMAALSAANNDAVKAIEKGRVSTEQWSQGLQGVGMDFNKAFQFEEGLVAKTKIDGIGEAMDRVLNRNWSEKFGDMMNGAVGSSMFEEITKSLGELDAALVGLTADKAAASFRQIQAEAVGAGVPVERLAEVFPQYAAKLRATAEAAGVFGLTQRELSDWMAGTVPHSVQLADMMGKLGASHKVAGKDAEAQAAALEKVRAATQAAAEAAIDASNTEIAYAQSLADAAEQAAKGAVAVDQATGKIDLHTEAGRAAQSSLNDLANAALRNRDSMAQQGATVETLNGTMQSARDEFVKVATQMGLNADQANKLADQYGLIPSKVTTNVTAPGATASEAETRAFADALLKLPKEVAARIATMWARGDYDAARAALAAEDGRVYRNYMETVRREIYQYSSAPQAGSGPTAFAASGGLILGPGTATSDSIMAMLSNGEFVQRAAAVDYYGADFMARLNRLQVPRSELPRFADGGPVRSRYTTSAPNNYQPSHGNYQPRQAGNTYNFAPTVLPQTDLRSQFETFVFDVEHA